MKKYLWIARTNSLALIKDGATNSAIPMEQERLSTTMPSDPIAYSDSKIGCQVWGCRVIAQELVGEFVALPATNKLLSRTQGL